METGTPLLDDDGALRMRRFMTATLASGVILAGVVTLLLHALTPDNGWWVSIGVGAMIGFWMCPMFGALIGNGLHEAASEDHG